MHNRHYSISDLTGSNKQGRWKCESGKCRSRQCMESRKNKIQYSI